MIDILEKNIDLKPLVYYPLIIVYMNIPFPWLLIFQYYHQQHLIHYSYQYSIFIVFNMFVRMSKQYEWYWESIRVYEDGLVDIEQTCDLIVANKKFLINSVSKVSGMQPTTKQPSDTILQLIYGNKITSGYIICVTNLRILTQILWRKNLYKMIHFIYYFFRVGAIILI